MPHSAWCSSRDLIVDANGDGVEDPHGVDLCADAVKYEPPSGEVFARRYAGMSGWDTEGTGLHLVDLNGDGWVDLLRGDQQYDPSRPMKAWLQSRTDSTIWTPQPDDRFEPPISTTPYWDGLRDVAPGVLLMDIDGDGATDIIQGNYDFNRSFISRASMSDLLRETRNGQGGVTEFTYDTAARQRDPALEGPATTEGTAAWDAALHGEAPSAENIVRWTRQSVVSALSVDGPNREPATTDYVYAHPRWSLDQRSSLGFRLVERTRPDGSTAEHFFYQQHGRTGRTSTLLVKDGGSEIFRREEDWELPTQLIPGSIDDDEVYVGRLKEVRSSNRYGSELGAEHVRTFYYNDSHGYNFVSQIDVSRPTGDLRTVFTPRLPNLVRWLIRLVAEQREEDPDTGAILSRSAFSYTTEGLLNSRTDDVQRRDGSDTLTTATTTFTYDPSFGNLIQRTDANEHVTKFCYDGDGDWCPSPTGQDSHSVLVGIQDPLDKLTSLTPDSVTGVTTQIDSEYDDEPTIRRTLDRFGRVEQEHVTPLGGSEFLRTQTVYHDNVTRPYTERLDYTAGAGSEFIRSAVVSDGFGGAWKTIEQNPSEAATPYRGVAVYRDPANGVLRETFPVACGDATCSALEGDEEIHPATKRTTDALGRPTRIDTPDGISVLDYSYADGTQPAGPGAGTRFDSVLTKNGKGDLTERFLDGDRAVWVDECSDTVAAATTSLIDTSCTTPDQTFYTYELTGEVSTVYDAVAVAAGEFNDPNHYLRYHYDTLGRVRQIDDPDGGTSLTEYDPAGNVASTTNARTQQTSFAYDALDRLTFIDYTDYPVVEQDVTITYRSGERQRERVASTGNAQTFDYDGLGRLERKTFEANSTRGRKTLLLDFAYDELDRTTTIEYPDEATVIQYEYEGAYLRRVCEVPSETDDCTHADAVSYVDNVVYDDLGRREEVHGPPGVRAFDYDENTSRVTEDYFAGVAPDNYTREINYTLYDEIGNIRTVQGATSTGDVDLSASYTYDQRNRVASWSKPSSLPAPEHFTYDSLGNLTGHGVPNAGDTNQVFSVPPYVTRGPHAIKGNTDTSTAYSYDFDGNLGYEAGPSGTYYVNYDSQNRLVCRGTTSWGCENFRVNYDADGNRVRMWANDTSQWEVVYAGELFQRNVVGGVNLIHIFAFGEQIAFKRDMEGTLRSAPAPWALPLRFDLPPPLAWGLLTVAGFGAGWLLLLHLGLAEAARQEPVGASLCLFLAVALALPPVPARGGGGGPVVLRYWSITDHLGSAAVWVDEGGAPYRETVYTPFGKTHAEASSGTTPPSIFAGHHEFKFSGYTYMEARWYNPDTGTFLSVDPVVANAGDPQAFNAYSYARNNPVTNTDPTGMSPGVGPLGFVSWGGIPAEVMMMYGFGFGSLGGISQDSFDTDREGNIIEPGASWGPWTQWQNPDSGRSGWYRQPKAAGDGKSQSGNRVWAGAASIAIRIGGRGAAGAAFGNEGGIPGVVAGAVIGTLIGIGVVIAEELPPIRIPGLSKRPEATDLIPEILVEPPATTIPQRKSTPLEPPGGPNRFKCGVLCKIGVIITGGSVASNVDIFEAPGRQRTGPVDGALERKPATP